MLRFTPTKFPPLNSNASNFKRQGCASSLALDLIADANPRGPMPFQRFVTVAVHEGLKMNDDLRPRESATHRYDTGQKVRLSRGFPYRAAAAGDYEVLGRLPRRDGEYQYRIKSARESHERVVKESELEAS